MRYDFERRLACISSKIHHPLSLVLTVLIFDQPSHILDKARKIDIQTKVHIIADM